MSKKNELKKIYLEQILPKMKKYKILQQNICSSCSKREFNEYAMDTGICHVCKRTKKVVNEFLYYSIVEMKFSIEKDWYSNIPRIYYD